jgi:hypothetical protein
MWEKGGYRVINNAREHFDHEKSKGYTYIKKTSIPVVDKTDCHIIE